VHSDSPRCPVRIWEISEPETIQFNDGSGGDYICHENVTQRAENGGKNAANDNKGRRKQVAGICPNLLNSFD
jgi:hypothetical protein